MYMHTEESLSLCLSVSFCLSVSLSLCVCVCEREREWVCKGVGVSMSYMNPDEDLWAKVCGEVYSHMWEAVFVRAISMCKHGVLSYAGTCANWVWTKMICLVTLYPVSFVPCLLSGPWTSLYKRRNLGAGEMSQRLRALTAVPEVLSSIPSNHTVAHSHL